MFNVLALVTEAYGGFGGIAQYNRDLIHALTRVARIENIYVLPRLTRGSVGDLPGKVVQTAARMGRMSYSVRALCAVVRVRPNLLFCGHLYLAPLAFLISKVFGVPYLVQLHGTEIWGRPPRWQRWALERAALVACVSRHTRAQVLKHTQVNPWRAIVLPNTVGSDYRPRNRATIRSALQIGDEFVLLTVGRLDARDGYKGHDRVIRAISRLPKDDARPVLYLISGEGEDLTRLVSLTERLGVQERVQFLGFRPRDALPDLYVAADLFVMASTGEGFGIVFLEAMASGTPAIGLAVGGAADPLDFEPWGRAVPEAEFEDAFCRALSLPRPDPAEMNAAVTSRFGQDVFAREAAAQIERLLVR